MLGDQVVWSGWIGNCKILCIQVYLDCPRMSHKLNGSVSEIQRIKMRLLYLFSSYPFLKKSAQKQSTNYYKQEKVYINCAAPGLTVWPPLPLLLSTLLPVHAASPHPPSLGVELILLVPPDWEWSVRGCLWGLGLPVVGWLKAPSFLWSWSAGNCHNCWFLVLWSWLLAYLCCASLVLITLSWWQWSDSIGSPLTV